MSKQTIIIGSILLVGVAVFFFFVIKQSSPLLNTEKVASVNNTGISKSTYQKKVAETESFYKFGKQNMDNVSSLKGDVLDALIDEQIVRNYAEKKNIAVKTSEVESRYKQVVAGYNKNNSITSGGDSAFLAKIHEMYGTEKEDYVQQLAYDILRDKVQTAVKMPLAKWLDIQRKTADIKKY